MPWPVAWRRRAEVVEAGVGAEAGRAAAAEEGDQQGDDHADDAEPADAAGEAARYAPPPPRPVEPRRSSRSPPSPADLRHFTMIASVARRQSTTGRGARAGASADAPSLAGVTPDAGARALTTEALLVGRRDRPRGARRGRAGRRPRAAVARGLGADAAAARRRSPRCAPPSPRAPTRSATPSARCATPSGGGRTAPPTPRRRSSRRWSSGRRRSPRPARVVDPGAGSGRFAVAAGRRFARAAVVAVERDPVAAIACRAHLAAAGPRRPRRASWSATTARADLGPADGRTLYLGNPPYVRHHQIAAGWKEWLTLTRPRPRPRGEPARRAPRALLPRHRRPRARPGDGGAFITSSEWLDTNYGRLVRELLLGPLGGEAIHVLEPTAVPFDDAAVTAAITCFRGRRAGRRAHPDAPRATRSPSSGRWRAGARSRPTACGAAGAGARSRGAPRAIAGGLRRSSGEICRVHRGAVTGRNSTWVVRARRGRPARVGAVPVHHPRARDLRRRGRAVEHRPPAARRRPAAATSTSSRAPTGAASPASCASAQRDGAHDGYIARARRAWWSVGLRPPAPILATYMARRPPAFIRNDAGARHINIAHGLYPRTELPDGGARRGSCAALRRTRLGGRRPHLRRRAHQVRAARDGAAAACPTPSSPATRRHERTFLPPPRWSPETLERDVAAAVESFRREREQEPLDQYLGPRGRVPRRRWRS